MILSMLISPSAIFLVCSELSSSLISPAVELVCSRAGWCWARFGEQRESWTLERGCGEVGARLEREPQAGRSSFIRDHYVGNFSSSFILK